MPAVKYYNPNTAVWEEVSTAGPQGVPGPPGPTGPVGTGAEEVAIADLQPTDPGLELWVDTLSPTPGMSLDELSDVDTVTTAPVEGDTLVFTGGLWVPGTGSVGQLHIEGGTIDMLANWTPVAFATPFTAPPWVQVTVRGHGSANLSAQTQAVATLNGFAAILLDPAGTMVAGPYVEWVAIASDGQMI